MRNNKVFYKSDAGWSSLVARRAHNPKVRGSNPLPATKQDQRSAEMQAFFVAVTAALQQVSSSAAYGPRPYAYSILIVAENEEPAESVTA